MPWTKAKTLDLYKGKGYDPDYRTKDKDLVVPEREPDKAYWPDRDTGDIYEATEPPEECEPNKWPKVGGYRTTGREWRDHVLPQAPEGWSPRQ